MKKIIALILAVMCVACIFAGCGSKEDKVLTMATNATFPPYEFYEDEKIVGIDAEIAAKIAEKLDMTLEIQDTEFGSIIAGVQTGKFDIGMAGMTVTDERKLQVNFSDTYATGIQSIIVPEGSSIKTVADLTGKKIGVQQDTTGHIYAEDEYGNEMVTPFNKGADAVAALVSGKVECVIIDNEPAKAYVAANEGLNILETEFAIEDYAIAISKENTELLEGVNKALKELTEDGTIKAIIDKYIGAK